MGISWDLNTSRERASHIQREKIEETELIHESDRKEEECIGE
jgi:hypothetical protein